jgi:hypothetical protein
MTATHTSRRALLKGAAMLTALPVAVSAGGVPLFDAIEDLLPSAAPFPTGPDLSTFDGRLRAAAEWLGLPPAPIAYDQEDPRGGVLITPDLMAWFDATDLRPHLRWIFEGDAKSATAEQQRTSLLQSREILRLFNGMDQTEQGLFMETLPRILDRSIPMEVIQAEFLARIDAHRVAKRARVQ